jgi:hypothetical protein
VPEIHAVVGFALFTLFTIGWVWGLALRVSGRVAGDSFWRWVAVADSVVGIQALIGMTLLLLGHRPHSWLHLVYGFGPLVAMAAAHWVARSRQRAAEALQGHEVARPWTPFAWAAFLNFGLTLRALMTGFGKG